MSAHFNDNDVSQDINKPNTNHICVFPDSTSPKNTEVDSYYKNMVRLKLREVNITGYHPFIVYALLVVP